MVNTDDNRSLKHALLTVLIASLCVGAAVAIVEILGGNAFDDTAARVVGTAVALTFYSLAGLAATRLGHRREELGGLAALELVVYAWGFIAALAALWVAVESEWLWRTAAIALVVTLGSAHGSLFLAARSAGESAASTFVRRATIAAGSVLTALLAIEIASADGDAIDVRALGVVAVLFVLGNAIFPLVSRLNGAGS